MALTSDVTGPGAIVAWHRRGATHFAGSFAVLVLATTATSSFTMHAVLVLLGLLVATGLTFCVLVVAGQAAARWTLLLWPVVAAVGIEALHTVAAPAAGLVTGLLVLSFLFIGLSQPPRWGLWFIPPAAVLFVHVIDLEPRQVAVRLAILVVIWIVCSEVPAQLVMELRRKNEALELLATTDSLTGLLNRTRLAAHLERVGVGGSVALIDLDRFKQFNDERGHVAGDVVLMDFATVLRNGVRVEDAVFRYGGEEFLVLMAGTTPAEAESLIARVRGTWSGHDSGLTFSVGITASGPTVVADADTLLYRAKAEGRDRVVVDRGDGGPVAVRR